MEYKLNNYKMKKLILLLIMAASINSFGQLVQLKSDTLQVLNSNDTVIITIYYQVAAFSAEPRFIQFNDRVKTEMIRGENTYTLWDDLKVVLHVDEEIEVAPGVFWDFNQTLDYLTNNGVTGLINGNTYILELKGW
jgi:hypothetical protein